MNPAAFLLLLSLILIPAWCPAAQMTGGFQHLPAVVGEVSMTTIRAGETLMDIARQEGLGYENIANANRHLDPWIPEVGAEVVLPRKVIVPDGAGPGIIINLAELRLFHLTGDRQEGFRADIYPLGIGREGRETPEGDYRVVIKKARPEWRVPEALRAQDPSLPKIMPSGPQNPLGDYWLGLSAPGYGIHGTNRPFGVGRRVSYGCLRMYPWDIAKLYGLVKEGTPVVITYQPIKAARDNEALLLEVHPDYLQRYPDPFQQALTAISKTGWPGQVDYARVREVVRAQNTLPETIGRHAPL